MMRRYLLGIIDELDYEQGEKAADMNEDGDTIYFIEKVC